MSATLFDPVSGQSVPFSPISDGWALSRGYVPILKFLSTAEIADVQAGTALLDLTNSIQSAIDSGEALDWGRGVYRHNGPLTLLPNDLNVWRGRGELTELRAGASMNYQVAKARRADGATVEPIFITDFYFNGNRLANSGGAFRMSWRGKLSNILFARHKTIFSTFGDETLTDTGSSYYGNDLDHIICYAGDGYQNFSSWPTHGMIHYPTSTDNKIHSFGGMYMTEAGIENQGGCNLFDKVHCFGDPTYTGTTSTGAAAHPLKRAVIAKATTIIGNIYSDTLLNAALRIETHNSVSCDSILPFYQDGQVVPSGNYAAVEFASGYEDASVSVGLIVARNPNTADPAWKSLSGTRPRSFTINSVAGGFTPPTGEAEQFVAGTFAVMGKSGKSAVNLIDVAAAGFRALTRYSVNLTLRAEVGTSNLAETGSNAGSNLEFATYDDTGATRTVGATLYRSNNQFVLVKGTIGDGSANSRVSFHGASPTAKQTITGAKGSNAALGSLISALSTLGLITDSTTT